jgi:hypothetical protein
MDVRAEVNESKSQPFILFLFLAFRKSFKQKEPSHFPPPILDAEWLAGLGLLI